MSLGILEIDHLLTYVPDLAAASQVYERLGFSLSPPSHIEAMGIVNRLVLLTERRAGAANFIELMSVADAARLPPAMSAVLAGEPGIKSMVMMTDDAAQAHRRLVQAGYAFGEPHHLRREWLIPGESPVYPEFDVLLPIPAPLSFNVCQYHNLHLYHRADWRRHANGARSVLACLAVAQDARACSDYYARLFARPAHRDDEGAWVGSPGATELVVHDPATFEARYGVRIELRDEASRYAGYRVGVASMATLRECLERASVPHDVRGERVIVRPAAACGNLIEFVTQP